MWLPRSFIAILCGMHCCVLVMAIIFMVLIVSKKKKRLSLIDATCFVVKN